MTKEEKLLLITEAREFGCESVTIEGVVYKLGKEAASHLPVPESEAVELVNPLSALDDLSDEEILYWSCGHYDNIQADKEKRIQQLKDDKNG